MPMKILGKHPKYGMCKTMSEDKKKEFLAKIDGSFDRKIKEAFVAGYWATAAIVDPKYGTPLEADLLFCRWKTGNI